MISSRKVRRGGRIAWILAGLLAATSAVLAPHASDAAEVQIEATLEFMSRSGPVVDVVAHGTGSGSLDGGTLTVLPGLFDFRYRERTTTYYGYLPRIRATNFDVQAGSGSFSRSGGVVGFGGAMVVSILDYGRYREVADQRLSPLIVSTSIDEIVLGAEAARVGYGLIRWPFGGADGYTWTFEGDRWRTASIGGGVAGTVDLTPSSRGGEIVLVSPVRIVSPGSTGERFRYARLSLRIPEPTGGLLSLAAVVCLAIGAARSRGRPA